MIRFALAAALLVLAPASAAMSDDPLEARVERLLAEMTLAEKLGQLTVESNAPSGFEDALRSGAVGNVINFKDADETRRVEAFTAQTRLRIPMLRGLDVLQGYRTQFVVPLGQAASFDPDLNRRAAEAIAREAVAQGVNWTFAPMVDVSRDPRWGRVAEGAGEDPHLGSLMAAARVRGYRAGGLVVTAKHFVGYGAPEAGLDYAPADMSESTLRDLHLPPFRAAVAAGAESIMPAFNALNGIPATVNRRLLDGVLRREWGFAGFLVSDWGAIDQLGNHGIDPDLGAMARNALAAGVDVDMASTTFRTRLPAEIAAGRVPMAAVDAAVRRVLTVKLGARLDRRTVPSPEDAEAAMLTPATRALAVEMARRSTVLLKNDGGFVPLDGVRRMLLVGGMADSPDDHVGPHAALWRRSDVVTVRRAIEARAAVSGVAVEYRAGCAPDCTSEAGFAEAVAAADRADVVLAVLGEPGDMIGEAASRADPNLPGRQAALLERLVGTGKPVILVVMSGRPLILPTAAERVPAILAAWYPGTFGAIGLAEILFGDVAPSGRLPMTWPRHAGQIPIAHNRLRSGRPYEATEKFTSKYIDMETKPHFPFGHGLSTTTFAYAEPAVDRTEVATDGTVSVSVMVTNTGPHGGREIVQAYVRDVQASRVRPERSFKGMAAVDLAPGETRRVAIRLDVRALGFHDETGAYRVEPGRFRVFVGPSSEADLAVEFTTTGPAYEGPAPVPD